MPKALGTVSISPGVLAMIARLTTISVPGVSSMASTGVGRFLSAQQGDGVKVQVVDNAVVLNLYIVAQADVAMLDLSREVQCKVTRAIHDIVGMAVREINVHIMDVAQASAS